MNKLTLCDKCNCMTKTIVTSNTPVCGKCKEIRTNSFQYDELIKQFLEAGTKKGLGDLSMMVGDFINPITSQEQKIREEALNEGYKKGYQNGNDEAQKEERERNYKNFRLWLSYVPKRMSLKYCNVCGSETAFIRGKYPNDDMRNVCPTCLMEILEQAIENTNTKAVKQLSKQER